MTLTYLFLILFVGELEKGFSLSEFELLDHGDGMKSNPLGIVLSGSIFFQRVEHVFGGAPKVARQQRKSGDSY